ncbi:MAG: class I SAM-dependent RNA methyltransferase [Lachnospiraceae bacterium]|nr:class I SAM-dependent RNA methyltransferase [Lachnospiraceae bacterium]
MSDCKHFGMCGGCAYRDIPYEKQLENKESEVKELLKDYIDDDCMWEGILPSPVIEGYRNKMEFSFGDSKKDGPLELGMHRKGSFYDIVTVDECKIVDEDYRTIIKETVAYFRGKETSYYHKKSHQGYLRHLLVRKGKKTGEILVDLVTSSQKPVDTICCEQGLLEDYVNLLVSLKLEGTIVGILNTINDSMSDAIKNERTELLYGRDHFFEELMGLKFRITPFSFFQTNSLSAEVIYSKAREYVNSEKDKREGAEIAGTISSDIEKKESEHFGTVYDLYSGTGTIAQLIAPVAKKVIGVEIIEEAVASAKENAALNGLKNCDFIAGDVLKVLDSIEEKPDYIILDPPRDGVNPKALRKIMDYGVDNILYISCKPGSLARDLQMLNWYYKPVKVCVVDQFPYTKNIETVCLLSKK